jgi:hypothetical protein
MEHNRYRGPPMTLANMRENGVPLSTGRRCGERRSAAMSEGIETPKKSGNCWTTTKERAIRLWGWSSTEKLKDIAAVVAICFGGAWAGYAFYVQKSDRDAGQMPALEVRITAKQVTLDQKNRDNLLASVKDKDDVHFIRGSVTIKNVGTAKTSVHLVECIKDGMQVECPNDGKNPGVEVVGPIVVAKLSRLVSGKMLFDERRMARFFGEPHRFFLQRRAVDKNRGDVEEDDDIRPQATDAFEFLVTVEGPGVYAVMFTTPIDEAESRRLEKTGELKEWPKPLRWDDVTLVEVLESHPLVVD